MNKLCAFIECSQLLRRFSVVVAFQVGAMLACHNYWHWALYHIEKVNSSVFIEKCIAISFNRNTATMATVTNTVNCISNKYILSFGNKRNHLAFSPSCLKTGILRISGR